MRLGRELISYLSYQASTTRPTAASGRLNGDGDGKLSTPYGDYSVEHKTRITPINELGPTKLEWLKGSKQGCQIFITTSKSYGSVVTLPLDLFKQLIGDNGPVQKPEGD